MCDTVFPIHFLANASSEHLDEKGLILNGSKANKLRSQSMLGSGNKTRSDLITYWACDYLSVKPC